jgi:hypothetical protein
MSLGSFTRSELSSSWFQGCCWRLPDDRYDIHGHAPRGDPCEQGMRRTMKAPRKKRRLFTQIMEEESGRTLRQQLPRQWAIHGYAPDYGIDGAVEIFEYTDETEAYAETLGESFFFQLKSEQSCDIATVTVPWRSNVEKAPYIRSEDTVEMTVVRYNFDDTDELLTIEAMGSGAVVVLFLVCLDGQRTFFLNLTDYIDKILTPEAPGWRDQGSKVLYIPVLNEVRSDSPIANLLLRYYAIRPKLSVQHWVHWCVNLFCVVAIRR